MSEASEVEGKHGALFALAAYTIWGFAPIYFVWVAFAQSLEIVAHRVFWAFPFLALIIWQVQSQILLDMFKVESDIEKFLIDDAIALLSEKLKEKKGATLKKIKKRSKKTIKEKRK